MASKREELEDNGEIYAKHESFICSELKPRLSELLKVRSEINEEINEYEKLKTIINDMKSSKSPDFKLKSDIGLGYQVEAVVNDPSVIYVHVGMGFHCEMNMASIPEFAANRQDLLRIRLDIIQEDCDKVASHIQDSLSIMKELKETLHGTN